MYKIKHPHDPDSPTAVGLLRDYKGGPWKTRRILNTIIGRPYYEALGMLQFMPHKAAMAVRSVLKQARNVMKTKYGMDDPTKLFITEACAQNVGWHNKQLDYRAQGRCYIIVNPKHDIYIGLKERLDWDKPRYPPRFPSRRYLEWKEAQAAGKPAFGLLEDTTPLVGAEDVEDSDDIDESIAEIDDDGIVTLSAPEI